MPITYTTSNEPSEALISAVGEELSEYNLLVEPSLTDVKSLAASAKDASGVLIGGAIGRTWGQCCELLELWVARESRKLGIGSDLLTMFEDHARQRGVMSRRVV